MHEIIKILGGITWAIAIVGLLFAPIVGIPVLLVTVVLTVRSVSMTKERRHRELLEASDHMHQ